MVPYFTRHIDIQLWLTSNCFMFLCNFCCWSASSVVFLLGKKAEHLLFPMENEFFQMKLACSSMILDPHVGRFTCNIMGSSSSRIFRYCIFGACLHYNKCQRRGTSNYNTVVSYIICMLMTFQSRPVSKYAYLCPFEEGGVYCFAHVGRFVGIGMSVSPKRVQPMNGECLTP